MGLRLGEALALRWQDIDVDEGTLRVRRALQWIDCEPHFVEPKSDRSIRAVALPSFGADTLRRLRSAQREAHFAHGRQWNEQSLIFISTVGTPLDDRNVRRGFKEILQAAELPAIRIHDLRHTCASLLLAQGVHPRVVMETLGHSQISLTLDTYSHILPALGRDAADRIDALLRVKPA